MALISKCLYFLLQRYTFYWKAKNFRDVFGDRIYEKVAYRYL